MVDCWLLIVDGWLLIVDGWLLCSELTRSSGFTYIPPPRPLLANTCVCVCAVNGQEWPSWIMERISWATWLRWTRTFHRYHNNTEKISRYQKISPPHQEWPRWFRHHSARLPHVAPGEIFNVASSVSLFSVFPIVTYSREIVMNFKTRRLTEEATAESPQRRKQKLKMILKKSAAA